MYLSRSSQCAIWELFENVTHLTLGTAWKTGVTAASDAQSYTPLVRSVGTLILCSWGRMSQVFKEPMTVNSDGPCLESTLMVSSISQRVR